MEVKTISKEIIKPSSTTPNDLRTLQLSVYDHCLPPVYTTAYLFYSKNDLIISQEHTSHKLKTSLSQTLNKFYPLAGRINSVTINCNDEGAIFVDARVDNYPLSNFLTTPDFKALQHLLALQDIGSPNEAAATWPLLLVKATYFSCGGMAIGICISHRIADAASISSFIQSWTAMARGEEVAGAEFSAANFYPPANEDFKLVVDEKANKISNIITKRFVFDGPKLEKLRTKAASTRVESVTALLWKCFVDAVASSKTSTGAFKVLIQPVNLRTKIPTLLPETLFGNIIFTSPVSSIGPEGEVKIEEVVKDLRKKREDLENLLQDEQNGSSLMMGSKLAYIMLTNYSGLSYETHEAFAVSSWCRLPFYEASFGWGSPVWVVGNVAPTIENIAVLVDSKDGQGIEALVILPEEDMSSLEQNQELLAFASLNPSVFV